MKHVWWADSSKLLLNLDLFWPLAALIYPWPAWVFLFQAEPKMCFIANFGLYIFAASDREPHAPFLKAFWLKGLINNWYEQTSGPYWLTAPCFGWTEQESNYKLTVFAFDHHTCPNKDRAAHVLTNQSCRWIIDQRLKCKQPQVSYTSCEAFVGVSLIVRLRIVDL